MEIVINKCYGGFGVSDEAVRWLRERGHELALEEACFVGEVYSDGSVVSHNWNGHLRDIPRDDPMLIDCIEALGDKANGAYAELAVVEIPDDVDWEIEEYDGREWIAEVHRTWG